MHKTIRTNRPKMATNPQNCLVQTELTHGMTAPPPYFPKADPGSPAFWNMRFDADFMPWDRRAAMQNLGQWLSRHPAPSMHSRVLIPGCGNAREIPAFVRAGYRVTAVDFAERAVEQAHALLAQEDAALRSRVDLHVADYFLDAPGKLKADVIYESAFLCALPPVLRENWAAVTAKRLAAGGKLVGYFFVQDKEMTAEDLRGPPFVMTRQMLDGLLSPAFTLVEEAVPPDSIAVFAGRERWMVWTRR